jgi:nucleotide-binding universal stress UspA family protein
MMMPDAALEVSASLESHMRKEGERVLAHMGSFLPSNASAVSKRLETGSPAEVIVNVAGDERVDLIVLGARGLGPIKELVLGSVSHAVLHGATCPVLIFQ